MRGGGFFIREGTCIILGNLAKHDGDGNEDVKTKDLMSRTIAQREHFKTVYIS